MFFNQTHFSLLSSVIDDDNGFPRIVLHFNTSDTAQMTLINPQQNTLFSETYYNGDQNESIYLSGYRTTVDPGSYRLHVVDSSKNTIFERTFQFNGTDLSLVTVSADTWNEKSNPFPLISVHLRLKNSGDLPAYPYSVTLRRGGTSVDVLLPFTVILPDDTQMIDCFVPLPESSTVEDNFNVTVFDNQRDVLLTTTSTLLKSNPIGSWEFSWYYLGQHTLIIPNVDWFFAYYQSLDRFEIVDYSAYVFDPCDNVYINFLTNRILSLRSLRTDVEKINFVASFVQSIEYKNDDPENSSYEYPRYPLETLKEKRGDCEDKAILTASLLHDLGYNVSLLRLPQHMAVGVQLKNTIPGYSYYVDDYYFLETTTLHMTLGRVPPEYEGLTNVTVYPISQRPLLVHQWKSATRYQLSSGEDYVHVIMILENLGTAASPEIEVHGAFYDIQQRIYNQRTTTVPSIPAGGKRLVEFSVDVPTSVQDHSTLLKTQVYLNGEMVNQRESLLWFP
jgi:predicted transglutaminase-like cysteine proteinase